MELELTRREEFALLTINRPDVLNALTGKLVLELSRLFDQVAASDARALLITGAGSKSFCAGADINDVIGISLIAKKQAGEAGQRAFEKLDSLPMPSIAVINGFALGGGLELALACTFRLATRNARMGLPEIKLGLVPGWGGTQRLPRTIGPARALEIIMTGRNVGAEEAERIGLVNRIIDGDPVEAGIAYAREMSGYSLQTLRFAREAVMRALDLPLHDALKVEADVATLAFSSADAAEGMNAFIQKTQAGFQGRLKVTRA